MAGLTLARAAAAACLLASTSACAPAVVAGAGVLGAGVAQERSTKDQLTDMDIQASILSALFERSPSLYSAVQIGVSEGRVLLTGAVPDPGEAAAVVQIAEAQKGAREVINELTVSQRGTEGAARDAWISAQANAKLVQATNVDALDYNIETYDGVVHLIGLAGDRAQLQRAAEAVATVPGVKQVVSHVLLIDDPRRKAPGA